MVDARCTEDGGGFQTIMNVLGFLVIFFLMMGMGATVVLAEFKKGLQQPKAIIIGMLCQFGFMPAIAFGLSKALGLPVEFAVGLIITGCCPGGTTSNVMSYW